MVVVAIIGLLCDAYAHTFNSGLNSTACPNSAGGKGIGSRTANDPDFVFNSSILSQAHEANMEFMAAAGGNIAARFIDPLNPPQSSILTINQKKVLVTPRNGY